MISSSPTLVLLAVDISTVFTAVFLIVMFLGWVMQVVQNQNEGGPKQPGGQRPNPPRPRPRPRPRDDRVASEIDAFLREVNSGRGNVDDDEPVIEVVRQPTRPPRRRPPERPPAKPPVERPRSSSQRRRHSANTDTSDIEAHAEGLGSGLRSHVTDYMADHLEQSVDQHLGDRAAEMPAEVPVEQNVHPLVARLRDPAGVRDAVLLSEILAGPRALRNR